MEKKDISQEFEEMDNYAFNQYLLNMEGERRKTGKNILLVIHSKNIAKAKTLKAIIEKKGKYQQLQFECEIEATIQEYITELNAFASGVKWKKIDSRP